LCPVLAKQDDLAVEQQAPIGELRRRLAKFPEHGHEVLAPAPDAIGEDETHLRLRRVPTFGGCACGVTRTPTPTTRRIAS
jgi:hypothetical protein